ncbi:MAG: signal peptidase II [Clostridia bacterium]|nr:signal peptidase II [Clostridia bacterium]
MISFIVAILSGLAVLVIDQLTKYFIISNFSLGESTGFIKGLIDIVYIHNEGAAWGMLSGKTWVLVAFTTVAMCFCVYLLWKYGRDNKLMLMGLSLVVSGGVGNLIDRIFRNGKVIDFLHFEFWPEFPVFNVADCAIVVGVGLLILYFMIDTVNEYKSKKSGLEKNADN